jgi:hypothetical protein
VGNDKVSADGDDNSLYVCPASSSPPPSTSFLPQGNDGNDELSATGTVLVLDGGPLPGINKCTLNGVLQTYDPFGSYQPIGNGCGD